MHFNQGWHASEYLSQANRWFIATANVFFQEDADSPQSLLNRRRLFARHFIAYAILVETLANRLGLEP